jgi:hypothetical protein
MISVFQYILKNNKFKFIKGSSLFSSILFASFGEILGSILVLYVPRDLDNSGKIYKVEIGLGIV